jgi:hypothetical protein
MNRQHLSLRVLGVSAAVLTMVLGTSTANVVQAQSTPPGTDAPPSTDVDTATGTDVPGSVPAAALATKSYFPLMPKNWPLTTIFGVDTANLSANANAIFGTGATWIRRNNLPWKDIEPTQGARNWSAASAVEADMIAAANRGVRLILVVHGTPSWAQQIAGSTCGPIRGDKVPAFAAFMRDAVTRYSKPPYKVKYWEIWNEQDAGPGVSQPGIPFGCWGNDADPYGGGGYYGGVLGQVSPQIRAADPQAKIMIGGLLLGCNPNSPPPGDACNHGRYLEGILRAGAAPHFDGVSFHAYDFFAAGNVLGAYVGGANWGNAWNTSGPVLIVKSQFVKSVLNQFGVHGKFLINTESGVLCWSCVPPLPSNFANTKAYYIAQAYSAAIAEGLVGNVWYSYEGWNSSELSEPAYTAYKTASSILQDATYAGPIGNGDVGTAGVRGYKFVREGKSIWVIWSLDGGAKNVTLPGTPAAITDAVGVAQAASASFQLSIKPLYIRWP